MKKLLSAILVVMIFLSGCALSDYLTGNVPVQPTVVEDEDTNLDSIVKEIEEETTDKEVEEITQELDEEVVEEEIPDEVVEEETTDVVEEEVDDESFIKISVKEAETVKLKPKAKDADNDEIIYTFSEPLDTNGEWQTEYGDAGNYLITITASDGKLTTSKKVLLTVERVNVAPVIEELDSKIEIEEGSTLTPAPKITDPKGEKITYTI